MKFVAGLFIKNLAEHLDCDCVLIPTESSPTPQLRTMSNVHRIQTGCENGGTDAVGPRPVCKRARPGWNPLLPRVLHPKDPATEEHVNLEPENDFHLCSMHFRHEGHTCHEDIRDCTNFLRPYVLISF